MSEIDWSKAPEWAAGFGYLSGGLTPIWFDDYKYQYIIGANKGDVFVFGPGGWLRQQIHRAIPRPSPAWSGEGLPPAGTVCEWFSPIYGWLGGKVVGHDGTLTVIAHNDGYTGCHPHEVRPIRTPEQIEADERQKAVDAMVEEIIEANAPASNIYASCAVALYDAGYRKQEVK